MTNNKEKLILKLIESFVSGKKGTSMRMLEKLVKERFVSQIKRAGKEKFL